MRKRQKRLVKLLVDERKAAKLGQQGLARRLRQHQSWVSRLESGERRVDVLEFLDLADAIGFDAVVALRKIAEVGKRA
jgi:transcriptional regulator with XRE-family HTH domain